MYWEGAEVFCQVCKQVIPTEAKTYPERLKELGQKGRPEGCLEICDACFARPIARAARVIYADPPWFYADRKKERKDNSKGETRFGIGAQGHYSAGCMTDEDLLGLKFWIQRVAAVDAYLFLWATSPRLDFAIRLGEAWGFKFVTQAFVWVKLNATDGRPFYGTGAYTGSNVEPVLLFRNRIGLDYGCWHQNGGGAFKPAQVIEEYFQDVPIREPHPRGLDGRKIHSRKPSIVRQYLEQWLGDQPRLELFATEQKDGWTALGHALSGRDIRDDLTDLAADIEKFDPLRGLGRFKRVGPV